MTEQQTWTIGRLLDWTKDYLAKQGADSARLDAEVLLAHARGCERIELYTAFDEEASESLRESFRALVRKRAAGTPVAYLVGYREFYSLTFDVTPEVLIPRPETEFLVVRLLDLARDHFGGQPIEVVDVGTGSGVLATCAGLYLPAGSQVCGLDKSAAALEVAKANAARIAPEAPIEFLASDLLAAVSDRTVDVVLSNPPYVSEAEFAELDPQVRDHEPRMALLGGLRGTEVIERLIEQGAAVLRPGGYLLMEISPMIKDAVLELLTDSGAFENVRVSDDLAKLPRVVEAMRRR